MKNKLLHFLVISSCMTLSLTGQNILPSGYPDRGRLIWMCYPVSKPLRPDVRLYWNTPEMSTNILSTARDINSRMK